MDAEDTLFLLYTSGTHTLTFHCLANNKVMVVFFDVSSVFQLGDSVQ